MTGPHIFGPASAPGRWRRICHRLPWLFSAFRFVQCGIHPKRGRKHLKHHRCLLWCVSIAGPLLIGAVTAIAQTSDQQVDASGRKAAERLDLNERMVRFCREKLGKKVGSGQCSALADEALPAIGAERRLKDAPTSGDYVWGTLICRLEIQDGKQVFEVSDAGKSTDKRRRTNVRAGDIIQFRNAEFEGRSERGIYRKTAPHHTAVIEQLSDDGSYCKILEQNWAGKLYVTENVLCLPDLTAGWLRVYRPIEKSSAPTTKRE